VEMLDLLKLMVERDASDLHLTAACPPMCRIQGTMRPVGESNFTPADLEALARSVMDEAQWQEFSEKKQINLVRSYPSLSRFRFNIYRQRGSVGIAVRRIRFGVSSIDELGLPAILKEVAMKRSGLVLIVGPAGSGKSTTLAALIDHRSEHAAGHILTIEDPIEFVHRHKQSIVTQRELGFDAPSFRAAFESALYQAPDMIAIGEIRDGEALEAAVSFADAGRLCLGTLRAENSEQAFEKILSFFPEARHSPLLLELSLNLGAIFAQRLVRGSDGKLSVAVEIVLDTPAVRDAVKRGEIRKLKAAIEQGASAGCQTLDQALFALYKSGRIGLNEALASADNPAALGERVKEDAAAEEKRAKAWNLKIKDLPEEKPARPLGVVKRA
jgi:twitching motility protein PilU